MMTRRRASGERPSQAARGVFDSFWLIVQFYHRKEHRETNHSDEPVGENTDNRTQKRWPSNHVVLQLQTSNQRLVNPNPSQSPAHAEERPQHTVELSAYWIGKYPVTNAEYRAFVLDAGRDQYWDELHQKDKGDHPVVGVTWEDTTAFCKWLSEKTDKDYQLPTEAQWEKAARGTDGRIYPWGNEWDASRLNSYEGGRRDTSPVGQYSPKGDSPYNVGDMAGNVREWCADWYDKAEYKRRAFGGVVDPEGPKEGTFRVLRGGAFSYSGVRVRCAARYGYAPYGRDYDIGFRVVLLP